VRLVATLMKGRSVEEALLELAHLDKRAAPIMKKLVQSALANAKVLGLDEKSLVVSSLRVDKGTILKRWMPRAHGRAFPIHKHTSHLRVELAERAEKKGTVKRGKSEAVAKTPAGSTAKGGKKTSASKAK
jgi:large subunit ribosomal protein L22